MEKYKQKFEKRSQIFITIIMLSCVCLIAANRWILPNVQISDLIQNICYITVLVIELVLIVSVMRIKKLLGNEDVLKKSYERSIK